MTEEQHAPLKTNIAVRDFPKPAADNNNTSRVFFFLSLVRVVHYFLLVFFKQVRNSSMSPENRERNSSE